jgi:hypothetical protein
MQTNKKAQKPPAREAPAEKLLPTTDENSNVLDKDNLNESYSESVVEEVHKKDAVPQHVPMTEDRD